MKERDKRVRFFQPQIIFIAKRTRCIDGASFLVEKWKIKEYDSYSYEYKRRRR